MNGISSSGIVICRVDGCCSALPSTNGWAGRWSPHSRGGFGSPACADSGSSPKSATIAASRYQRVERRDVISAVLSLIETRSRPGRQGHGSELSCQGSYANHAPRGTPPRQQLRPSVAVNQESTSAKGAGSNSDEGEKGGATAYGADSQVRVSAGMDIAGTHERYRRSSMDQPILVDHRSSDCSGYSKIGAPECTTENTPTEAGES